MTIENFSSGSWPRVHVAALPSFLPPPKTATLEKKTSAEKKISKGCSTNFKVLSPYESLWRVHETHSCVEHHWTIFNSTKALHFILQHGCSTPTSNLTQHNPRNHFGTGPAHQELLYRPFNNLKLPGLYPATTLRQSASKVMLLDWHPAGGKIFILYSLYIHTSMEWKQTKVIYTESLDNIQTQSSDSKQQPKLWPELASGWGSGDLVYMKLVVEDHWKVSSNQWFRSPFVSYVFNFSICGNAVQQKCDFGQRIGSLITEQTELWSNWRFHARRHLQRWMLLWPTGTSPCQIHQGALIYQARWSPRIHINQIILDGLIFRITNDPLQPCSMVLFFRLRGDQAKLKFTWVIAHCSTKIYTKTGPRPSPRPCPSAASSGTSMVLEDAGNFMKFPRAAVDSKILAG